MPDLTALTPTMEDTLGPYFPAAFARAFPGDAPPGERIRLTGTIQDADGSPVTAAIIETWQADGAGACAGFTRQHIVDGRFDLTTTLPGAAPPRAPHITLALFCDGIAKLTTQIFLGNDPRNAADPVLASVANRLRSRLIARRIAGAGLAHYRCDLILRGPGETPFFDDLAG